MVYPEVIGPIAGANPPWGEPGQAASELGYEVKEYRLEGTASAFESAPGTSLEPNGRWRAVAVGQAQYRTRILVVRPSDPALFNGTVLLNWQNVSAGVESSAPRHGETYRGYAWVGVSAQEVGIYGFPGGLVGRERAFARRLPLVDHDRERYGDLHHPGDQGSFDIFGQAALAVGPNRKSDVDPLEGLDVRRVIATGGSQSAMRLVAYINGVHVLNPVVDGFVLSLWEGRAPALHASSTDFGGVRTTVRTDVTEPVVIVNSEFEALRLHAADTFDSQTLRVWEVAGTPHAPGRRADRIDRRETWTANPLSLRAVHDSALRRVHEWLAGGAPAAHQPRIEIEPGPPAAIRRDPLGNALGGIRLPELQAPTSEYQGVSFGKGTPPMMGASRRLSDETLKSLYPDRAAYLDRWNRAVDKLIESSAVLPEDASVMRLQGETVRLPLE